MKWARIKNDQKSTKTKANQPELTPDEKKMETEGAEYVEDIENSKPSYLYQQGFKEWLICTPQYKLILESENYKSYRKSYEALVGGFLIYFEKYCSAFEDDDRTIYFDWGKINKGALTIFLKPLYNPYYIGNKKIRGSELSSNSKYRGGMNSMVQRSPLAPPPQGGQTDPPQPPGFPPPPRNFND